MVPTLVAVTMTCISPDTLRVGLVDQTPAFDGVMNAAEWGPPTLTLSSSTGPIQFWLRRTEESVFIAAAIPDSTPFWGDELVISLDTRGDCASSPQHDDFQFAFHRVLDSSVVYRGNSGAWMAPRGDPDWRLGGDRSGGGWEVNSASSASGWWLELKLEEAWFEGAGQSAPGLALRVYDNDPRGWYAWPPAPDFKQPTMVEQRPDRWSAVLLHSP